MKVNLECRKLHTEKDTKFCLNKWWHRYAGGMGGVEDGIKSIFFTCTAYGKASRTAGSVQYRIKEPCPFLIFREDMMPRYKAV